MTEAQKLALVAASQSSAALAELTRFASEGPQLVFPFGDVEVIELLADGLKLAIEAQVLALGPAGSGDPESDEMRDQLLGAVSRFLEGWA